MRSLSTTWAMTSTIRWAATDRTPATMNTYSHVADQSMLTVAERMEDTLWNPDD